MSLGRHLVIILLLLLALRLVLEAPLGITGHVDLLSVRLDAAYVVPGILTALCGAVIEAGRGKLERLGFAPGAISWGLLLTQGLAAAMLTFISPADWLEWLGSGELWEVLYHPVTRTVAGVWLGVVLVRSFSGDRAAA